MKKIILLSAVTASLVLATNGDIMIGDGAKATGMGGVGIAVSHGAESLYTNPAMIKDVKNSEFSGYVTMFEPDVNLKTDAHPEYTANEAIASKSDADRSFIPGIAYVHRNNDNIVWGASLAGTAGMGTDYEKTANAESTFYMQTELGIMKLSVPVAYTRDDLTIALAPVLQYSTLEINYESVDGFSNNKKASSTGLGITAGLAYDVGDLTLGAMYKSKIEALYKNNIGTAMKDFNLNEGAGLRSGDQLDQPAEIGVGVAYELDNNTFAMDLKRIQWSDARGYKEFNWQDQNVIALGYQYMTPSWALRAGYNYGKSPIEALDASGQSNANYNNGAINYFNLSGFPAIVEEHFTLGGDYAVSKALTLSIAAVYSPEVSNTFETTAMTYGASEQGFLDLDKDRIAAQSSAMQASRNGSTTTVKHAQQAITLGATYKF